MYYEYRNPRRKSTRPRDSQRQKMYDWEEQVVVPMNREVLRRRITFSDAKALVHEVFSAHGEETPGVFLVKDKSRIVASYYHRHPKTYSPAIVFTNRGLTLYTALHEIAHGLKYGYMDKDEREAGHGSLFVRVYIHLLQQYTGLSVSDLLATARLRNLKVAPRPDFKCPMHPVIPTKQLYVPAVAAKTVIPKTRKESVQLSVGTLTWTIPTTSEST